MRTRHQQSRQKANAALSALVLAILLVNCVCSAPYNFIGHRVVEGRRSSIHCQRAAEPEEPSFGSVTLDTDVTKDVESARADLERAVASSGDGNVLLLCKACGEAIAALRFCEGTSRHFNPAGCLFHIGHFSRAGGAAAVGEASSEHTFFPGYLWRVALCRSCRQQVGWRYEQCDGESNGKAVFHGLIWNRLVKARRPAAAKPS